MNQRNIDTEITPDVDRFETPIGEKAPKYPDDFISEEEEQTKYPGESLE